MQRLKTRAQFQAVLSGQTLTRTHHFALHSADVSVTAPLLFPAPDPALAPASEAWLGAMVPKRWAKRAVTRNAIKRQIYAVSPDFSLASAAYVVRLRAGFDRKLFVSASSDALKKAVRDELIMLFRRGVEATHHAQSNVQSDAPRPG